MKFSIELTPEQFETLLKLLNDAVKFYEGQAAILSQLDDEEARNLARERVNTSQSAAELARLLAQQKEGDHA